MKLQRGISVWSGSISIVSLGISIIFNLFKYDFISNVFIGLFSSGSLICVTGIITYFSERNKTILALYRGCFNYMEQLNLNLTHNNQIALDILKENLSKMMHSYNVDVYYYVCELSGIRKKSELNKIIMAIWESARNIYLLIADDNVQVMKFYLGDIAKEDIIDYKFKHVSPESLKYVQGLQKSLDDLRYRMNYYNCRKGEEEKHYAD